MTATAPSETSSSLSALYQRQGYVVISKAIPDELIEQASQAQLNSSHNKLLVFRGQGVVGYERARWNDQGQMIKSIHNPHLLGLAPKLSNAIRSLVFSDSVYQSLCSIAPHGRWSNWQTMLFDRSVGTDVHLDTWFLDTNPRGHLIGLWIALEDIYPDCGPFVVYPGSHLFPLRAEMDGLANLLTLRNDLIRDLEARDCKPKRLLLKRGDLVLWNSLLAHGSDLPSSNQYTRKSVTAHFFPVEMDVIRPPIERAYSIYNHANPVDIFDGKLYQSAVVNPLLYSGLCLSMYAIQKLKTRKINSGKIRRG
jgi:phytanoyl-CoA hydroxylase